MGYKAVYEDLSRIDYKVAWDLQAAKLKEIVDAKVNGGPNVHHLYFCEHPHVYTLGKSGKVNNLLIQDEFLKKIDAVFYKIDRGGDITYHGPGQLVGYPIFDLESFGYSVKKYIYNIEEAIILTLKEYNIITERLPEATGVWLDVGVPGKTRKICAIGVKASRYVTMHGFALNVNTNLSYFSYINPCGFIDKGVTSMEKELSRKLDFEQVKVKLKDNLRKVFEIEYI